MHQFDVLKRIRFNSRKEEIMLNNGLEQTLASSVSHFYRQVCFSFDLHDKCRKGIHAKQFPLMSQMISVFLSIWRVQQLFLPLTIFPFIISVALYSLQVNGVNTKGLRHSEVVALIKSEREEVRLLVVDQETDELFHRLGITPTSTHIKGLMASFL